MSRRWYAILRDLHLYFGLFVSPFVLVFASSVFLLVHGWRPSAPLAGKAPQPAAGIRLPPRLEQLGGREQVTAIRPVLDQLGVTGEIGFVRHVPKEHRLVVSVTVPGVESTVELDYQAGAAAIARRETGFAGALIYLHNRPARTWPRSAAIGSWFEPGDGLRTPPCIGSCSFPSAASTCGPRCAPSAPPDGV